MLQGKFTLASIPGIRFPQNRMSVPRNDLATLQSLPDELFKLLRCNLRSDFLDNILNPAQNLLVSQTMQGTGQSVHTSGHRKIRVRKRTSHQVDSVRTHIPSFMVGVNGQVQTHQLVEFGVLIPQHVRKIGSIVQSRVGPDRLPTLVGPPVNIRSDFWQPCDQVHGILVSGLPVLALINTLLVSAGELALGLESHDPGSELRHGVSSLGQRVEHIENVAGNLRSVLKLLRQCIHLLFAGHLAGNQQPKQTFRQRLAFGHSRGKLCLALGNGHVPEPDTLIGVQQRRLPQHALDPAHATDCHVDGCLAERVLPVLGLQILQARLLFRDQLLQARLEIRVVRQMPHPLQVLRRPASLIHEHSHHPHHLHSPLFFFLLFRSSSLVFSPLPCELVAAALILPSSRSTTSYWIATATNAPAAASADSDHGPRPIPSADNSFLALLRRKLMEQRKAEEREGEEQSAQQRGKGMGGKGGEGGPKEREDK
ncbi:hypothetical protein Mapa_008298 [Marchantia paleacea]|nr:hypothetical protein Mapa_008298 [Marchantia paleacea]